MTMNLYRISGQYFVSVPFDEAVWAPDMVTARMYIKDLAEEAEFTGRVVETKIEVCRKTMEDDR
jgi:hypothetical protein